MHHSHEGQGSASELMGDLSEAELPLRGNRFFFCFVNLCSGEREAPGDKPLASRQYVCHGAAGTAQACSGLRALPYGTL